MRRGLPPLNAVRAFEAAGRHESFVAAAQELHVTPGAISRHVKALEELLGVRLFTRANRQVRLTPDAIAYHRAVSAALDRLGDATHALVAERRDRPLRVMCSEVVAMRWLFPRLPRIHASHPQMPLSFRTSLTAAELDFDPQASDVVIRVGNGRWPPELACHRLFDSQLVAICSPRLLERGPPLRDVADLRAHTLLGSGLRPQAWPRWLASAGAADLKFKRYIELENSALAYQAAEEGLGVALGERGFLGDDLRARHLVIPLRFVLAGDEAFYLVYERQQERTPHLLAFRDWVLNESRLVRAALAEPPRVASLAAGTRSPQRAGRAAH